MTRQEQELAQETISGEQRYHPVKMIARQIYGFLASAKLAMALLVVILACCVVGVTIYRGKPANDLIFSSLWFNALLVLLVTNVAFCFFGRIWGRRVTLISFGMILFHLSFVAVFLGVAYNSLFYFRGNIRLTEGESLPNNDPQNYDSVDHGRFFRYSRLKGETTLIRLHAGYRQDGKDKRVGYEVEMSDGTDRKRDIIYVTKYFAFKGTKYFRDKEGYSLLVTLADGGGTELYGAFIPLQSYRVGDDLFRYAMGTKEKETGTMFPVAENPLFNLQMEYIPVENVERSGSVTAKIVPYSIGNGLKPANILAQGTWPIGAIFSAGDFQLCAKEVRYWTSMRVTFEPGQPVILASLWTGLAGMIITTAARMIRAKV